MIRNNRHKYSVSAMCGVLQIARSTYYYEARILDDQEEELTELILDIFKKSRNNYGQRKIKVESEKKGWIVSRRRIGRIMKEQGLVSKYTVAPFKPSQSSCNESEVGNALNRELGRNGIMFAF